MEILVKKIDKKKAKLRRFTYLKAIRPKSQTLKDSTSIQFEVLQSLNIPAYTLEVQEAQK